MGIAYLIVLFGGTARGRSCAASAAGPGSGGLGITVLIGPGDSFIAGPFAWYVLHRHGGGLVLSVLFSMLPVWLFVARAAGVIPAAAAAAL